MIHSKGVTITHHYLHRNLSRAKYLVLLTCQAAPKALSIKVFIWKTWNVNKIDHPDGGYLGGYLGGAPAGVLQAGYHQVPGLHLLHLLTDSWSEIPRLGIFAYLAHGAVDHYWVVMHKLVALKVDKIKVQ